MKQIQDHPLGSTFLTRRDFLRLGATGIVAALGFTLPSQRYLYQLLNQINKYWIKPREPKKYFNLIETLHPAQQGRVLDASIDVYDLPSFSARLVNTYYRDWILPITDISI